MKQHYVYIDGSLDPRGGGPAGYLANLDYGLKKIKLHKNIDILHNSKKSGLFQKKYRNKLAYNKDLNDISWTSPENIDKVLANMTSEAISNNFNIKYKIAKFININKATTLHLHSTRDVCKMDSFFRLNGKQIPFLLTSHSPSIPHKEMKIYADQYLTEEMSEKYCKLYENFDINAFTRANVLIFPSEDAVEAYYSSWDKFSEITKNKDFRYLPTGCKPLGIKTTSERYRQDNNIPKDSFVISYIGRHDTGKGYDILKEAGKYILDKYSNVYFLIAGATKPIEPLQHPRWIEKGYINNPGDLLNTSDLFVLPNRVTFYDLILIENLSVGTPVLCSYTGGNKSISKLSDGIMTYKCNVEDLIKNIENIIINLQNQLPNYKKENIKCYQEHFTIEKFASNYYKLIENIQADYSDYKS